MSPAYKIAELKFEDQNLTSFAGLAIFQPLMKALEIKNRLSTRPKSIIPETCILSTGFTFVDNAAKKFKKSLTKVLSRHII